MPPTCVDCGREIKHGSRRCWACYRAASPSTDDMTEAELDALIAERRPTMPKEVSTRKDYPLQRRTVKVRGRKRKGQEE